MKGLLKKLLSIFALALGLVTTSACNSDPVDYVSTVKLEQADWKTSDYLTTGLGVVTLKHSVDGDTAHFYAGKYNRVIQGRSTRSFI